MSKRELMKGNTAIAEAAIRAGAEFFAGYPITPSTEVLEHLAARMPEEGRVFIQAENELAAMNMVHGAYGTGHRAFTATSGPGLSLKQEAMSFAAAGEVPYVVILVNRYGRGVGALDGAQDAYFQVTRGGGQGDYRNIVYTPAAVQEAVEDMYEAFDVAEKYRIAVYVMLDTILGQTMEPVEMPDYKTREIPLDWGVDGTNTKGLKVVKFAYDDNIRHWKEKIEKINEEMQRWESYKTEDAEFVFVAFGLAGRVCFDAVDELRARGEKVGCIRPKLIFPYPVKAFEELNKELIKGFMTVEGSDMGQQVQDVALSVKKVFDKNLPVYCYPYSRGEPEVANIIAKYEAMKSGELKEVY